jgi:hypothetical protein
MGSGAYFDSISLLSISSSHSVARHLQCRKRASYIVMGSVLHHAEDDLEVKQDARRLQRTGVVGSPGQLLLRWFEALEL